MKFDEITSTLERLVRDGYERNREEILGVMPALADENVALRRFVAACESNPKFMGLLGAQSFLLAHTDSYLMRLNIWTPATTAGDDLYRTRTERYMSINVCHNHNFDFFTVGVFGPGYSSEYRHAAEPVTGKTMGELVEFNSVWTVQLRKAHAMYVRKYEDFHTQFAPETLSMTVNVIPHCPREPSKHQLVLEDRTWRVRQVLLPVAGDDEV